MYVVVRVALCITLCGEVFVGSCGACVTVCFVVCVEVCVPACGEAFAGTCDTCVSVCVEVRYVLRVTVRVAMCTEVGGEVFADNAGARGTCDAVCITVCITVCVAVCVVVSGVVFAGVCHHG